MPALPVPTAQDPATQNTGGASTADGTALYDSIMAQIEPELLTANLPNIVQLAGNDTPEQKQDRAKRYAAAFTEYDRRFQAKQLDWQQNFKSFKHEATKYMEQEMRPAEEKNLLDLEQSMASVSPTL